MINSTVPDRRCWVLVGWRDLCPALLFFPQRDCYDRRRCGSVLLLGRAADNAAYLWGDCNWGAWLYSRGWTLEAYCPPEKTKATKNRTRRIKQAMTNMLAPPIQVRVMISVYRGLGLRGSTGFGFRDLRKLETPHLKRSPSLSLHIQSFIETFEQECRPRKPRSPLIPCHYSLYLSNYPLRPRS